MSEPEVQRIDAEKLLLVRADRIIVSTLAEQTQLRFLYRSGDRKLEIIPPGVDTGHFYPIPADEAKLFVGLKPDDRMVLFVGRIEPLKGVYRLAGKEQAGLYTIAALIAGGLLLIPQAINNTAFPYLSGLLQEPRRLRRVLSRYMRASAMASRLS